MGNLLIRMELLILLLVLMLMAQEVFKGDEELAAQAFHPAKGTGKIGGDQVGCCMDIVLVEYLDIPFEIVD